MKIQNNKTKTITTIITVLVIGLVMSSTMTVFPNVGAQKVQSTVDTTSTYPQKLPHVQIAPSPPSKVGCYHWTKETGWLTVACTSQAWLDSHLPKLTEGGQTYGVLGGLENSGSTLNFGETYIDIATFSGEYDSSKGSGAFSIQTNTNDWVVNNVDYADQFGWQNDPSSNGQVCVYQNDLTHGGTIRTCTSTYSQSSMYNGYTAYTDGSTNTSVGTITANFCNSSQCWAATDTDYYGLAGNWKENSGTILGYGSGSTATFTSPTTEYTTITDSAPSSFTISSHTNKLTNEMNSLSYNNSYTSTSCSGSTCYLYTESN